MTLIFVFAFGAIVGSFLNVVILRFNTGRGIGGRSGCSVCGAQLRWFELLPIVSFLIQRGRCRSCQSKLSWQYPLVELLTGALFVAVWYLFAPSVLFFMLYATIWSLLVVMLVYDIHHKIIPDAFVYAFCALSLLTIFLRGDATLWGLLAGPLCAAPFALLWLISRGAWMGFGDAKLALGIGWLLGLVPAFSALILSFWTGACISVGIMLWERLRTPHSALSGAHGRFTMKSEVPFAPFLILGTALVFFFDYDILAWLLF